jgi:sialic acid synthase SpsE
MQEMAQAFPEAPIGLSDHSTSNAAGLAAVALGACLVERHFTDSKSRSGPDIVCSMDPDELRQLLQMSNEIFLSLGGVKGAAEEEEVTINFAFASVASLRPIGVGEIFTSENIFPLRPNGGEFGPLDFKSLLGKRASRDIDERVQIRSVDVRD